MIQFNKREKIMLSIIVISFLFFVSYEFLPQFEAEPPSFEEQLQEEDVSPSDMQVQKGEEINQQTKEVTQEIVIDIKGAVQKPGVYTIHNTARVTDVIAKAGGVLPEADLTQVNLAAKIYDEMMIYVPTKGEDVSVTTAIRTDVNSTGKISINKADEAQLVTLDGIGPAKAKAIIAYREENGPYKSAEDLLSVSGIGQKTLDAIKEKIVVH